MSTLGNIADDIRSESENTAEHEKFTVIDGGKGEA